MELDGVFWKPDWIPTPRDEFRVPPDGWVCAGNYTSLIRDIILSRVNTVIWLGLPFRVIICRFLLRALRRARKQELLWGTNRES